MLDIGVFLCDAPWLCEAIPTRTRLVNTLCVMFFDHGNDLLNPLQSVNKGLRNFLLQTLE